MDDLLDVLSENENDIKQMFSTNNVSALGACENTKHLAIFPVRFGVTDSSSELLSVIENNFISHYNCLRLLQDGWLYMKDYTNFICYEYKVEGYNYILNNIYKNEHSLCSIKTNIGEANFYIRCLHNTHIGLFFSYVAMKKETIEKLTSPYITPLNLNDDEYLKGIFPQKDVKSLLEEQPLPKSQFEKQENNIKRIISLREYITDLLNAFNSSDYSGKVINEFKYYTLNENDFYKEIRSLFYTISEFYKKNRFNFLRNIVNELGSIKEEAFKNMQHKQAENKILFHNFIKTQLDSSDFANATIDLIKKTIPILEKLLSIQGTIYTDGTMPINSITTDVIDTIKGESIKKYSDISLLKEINEDPLVKDSNINMFFCVRDPLGVIEDLLCSIEPYSNSLAQYYNSNKYETIIAESCFNILYPNSKIQKEPYTTYKNTEKCSGGDCNKINQDKLFNKLIEWENVQRARCIRDKDLITYLNTINTNTTLENDFISSVGFDKEDKSHIAKLIEHLSNVYTKLTETPEGLDWLEKEFTNPKSIGLLPFGFNRELFEQTKVFSEKILNNISLKEKLENIQSIGKSTYDLIIEHKSLQKQLKKHSNKTFNILCELVKDNQKIKDLFAHISICLITTFNYSAISISKKHHYTILTYTSIISTTADCEIKINKNFKNDFATWWNNWLKDNKKSYSDYLTLKRTVAKEGTLGKTQINDNNYQAKDTKTGAKKRIDDLNNKEKNLQTTINTNKQRLKFCVVDINKTANTSSSQKDNTTIDITYTHNPKNYASTIVSAIDLLLEICKTYCVIEVIKNQKSISSEIDPLNIITNILSVTDSGINILDARVKLLHPEYFINKSHFLGNSGNHKLPSATKYMETIRIAGATISIISSFITITKSINDLKGIKTKPELAVRSISIYFSILALVVSILEAGSVFSGPIGGIVILIALGLSFLSSILADYLHKTSLQLWLEHCSFRNDQKTKGFNSSKEELLVLQKIMLTPIVTFTKEIADIPVINYGSSLSDRFSNTSNILAITNIKISIILPSLIYNMKNITFSVFVNDINTVKEKLSISLGETQGKQTYFIDLPINLDVYNNSRTFNPFSPFTESEIKLKICIKLKNSNEVLQYGFNIIKFQNKEIQYISDAALLQFQLPISAENINYDDYFPNALPDNTSPFINMIEFDHTTEENSS